MSALEVAAGIAAALGDGWRAAAWEHHDWSAYVLHSDGRGLFLEGWTRKGRFIVEGVYPQGWRPRRGEEPPVTVSASRDPVAIARDLRSRMLPRYEALLAVAVRESAQWAREDAQRDAVAAAVMAAVPGSRLEQGNTVPVVRLDGPFGWGSKVRTGHDPATVDLVLKGIPAGAVAGLLRELAGGRTVGHGGAAPVGAVPAVPGAGRRLWRLRAAIGR